MKKWGKKPEWNKYTKQPEVDEIIKTIHKFFPVENEK
jgi:hypothetical protein